MLGPIPIGLLGPMLALLGPILGPTICLFITLSLLASTCLLLPTILVSVWIVLNSVFCSFAHSLLSEQDPFLTVSQSFLCASAAVKNPSSRHSCSYLFSCSQNAAFGSTVDLLCLHSCKACSYVMLAFLLYSSIWRNYFHCDMLFGSGYELSRRHEMVAIICGVKGKFLCRRREERKSTAESQNI
mmetsp:Transcript_2982/g.5318  ORF Transcript_2982/g.5318 Transcript_2982/m.5318 type:complete len:185 (+) Transcript_2982:375-929(+)